MSLLCDTCLWRSFLLKILCPLLLHKRRDYHTKKHVYVGDTAHVLYVDIFYGRGRCPLYLPCTADEGGLQARVWTRLKIRGAKGTFLTQKRHKHFAKGMNFAQKYGCFDSKMRLIPVRRNHLATGSTIQNVFLVRVVKKSETLTPFLTPEVNYIA